MKKTKLLWYFTAFLLVVNTFIYLTHWGGDNVLQIVSDTLPIICSLISVVCLFSAFRQFKTFDFAKMAWMFILIGMSFNFIAETLYGILEVFYGYDMNEVFPTLADYFWCAGYVGLFAGLFWMIRGYVKSGLPLGNVKLYVLISLVFIGFVSIFFYFFLSSIITDGETSLIAKFFYLSYPIGDLFVVIPAVIIMYITSLFGGGAIAKPWKYMSVGFISFTVADMLYSYLSWNDNYGNGNLIDLAWHLGYLLIGLAALHQVELMKSFKEKA